MQQPSELSDACPDHNDRTDLEQMTSSFISSQKTLEQQVADRAGIAKAINEQCWAFTEDQLPSLRMMNIIGSHDVAHFKRNMTQVFSELYWRGLLSTSSNVVDIGCGCGRLALPISRLLKEGRYYGVDVWSEGVDWCKAKIESEYQNCSFYTIKAENNYYFEERAPSLHNDFKLEFCPTNTADLAFAISVFSHLTRSDCVAYFKEVSRVLKPKGILYLTGFVIDRFFKDYQSRTESFGSLREEEPGCFYAFRGQDFCGLYQAHLERHAV
ncbi:methyltransferase domain-containing protein [Microvirga aerilata]|uniref:class I SAM-dependent methyltransferase n=1 Tax=Microvirga aerilata TaxID=670292 RepID=UPI00362F7233